MAELDRAPCVIRTKHRSLLDARVRTVSTLLPAGASGALVQSFLLRACGGVVSAQGNRAVAKGFRLRHICLIVAIRHICLIVAIRPAAVCSPRYGSAVIHATNDGPGIREIDRHYTARRSREMLPGAVGSRAKTGQPQSLSSTPRAPHRTRDWRLS
jgi:hypothetical protein